MPNPKFEANRTFLRDSIRQRVDFSRTAQSRRVPPLPLQAPCPPDLPRIDLPDGQAALVRLGRMPVGEAIARRESVRHYEVGRIFIAPPSQNQGIGKQVFEFLWTAYPLAKRWTLGTPKWNARTRHFYHEVGFEEVGEDGQGGVLFERSVEVAGR